MKKIFISIISIICFFGSNRILYAQQNIPDQDTKIHYSKNGTIKYIKFGKNETLLSKTLQGETVVYHASDNSSEFFNQILKSTSDDQFELVKKRQLRTGYIIERYEQKYKGISVRGGLYSLHFHNGNM
jgi:Zn-dependent metalloprotease